MCLVRVGTNQHTGRQDKVFYTSPTIRYAGLSFYAEPQDFDLHDGGGATEGAGAGAGAGAKKKKKKGKGKAAKEAEAGFGGGRRPMQGQVVLQCRQKPGSFKVQRETMRFSQVQRWL